MSTFTIKSVPALRFVNQHNWDSVGMASGGITLYKL